MKGMAGFFAARSILNFGKDLMGGITEASKMAHVLGMSTEAFTGLQDGLDKAGGQHRGI